MRFWFAAALLALAPFCFGCTDFIVKTADGKIINGRSMEFGMAIPTQLKIYSRGDQRDSRSPDGNSGVSWTSKYGFLAAVSFEDCVIDGMNEAGLSFGYLWLPGTKYQTVSPADAGQALDFVDVGAWILGKFSTVQEAKEALQDVLVWGHSISSFAGVGIPPVHIALHDAKGKNLVVEFVRGEMKIYDNPNGVLTNYPNFDWQLINLQNYLGLNAVNVSPVQINGTILGQTGQGSGLAGIPGDWTPPSRFVKMTTLLRFAKAAENVQEGVNLAEHLLNTVDIPMGEIREKKNSTAGDYTQWAVVKDLSNGIFYFRSYKDLALKSIDLKKINFNQRGSSPSISIETGKGYADMTSSFRPGRITAQADAHNAEQLVR